MLVKSETWRFWRACIPRFPRERSDIGSVLRIEFIANGLHPAPFEAGDPDRPPILRSADQRREHQLQDCLLAPCIGNDLHAPALLNVHSLKQVGGADHLAMLAPASADARCRLRICPFSSCGVRRRGCARRRWTWMVRSWAAVPWFGPRDLWSRQEAVAAAFLRGSRAKGGTR